jgi:hypothetical protein
LLAAEWVLTSAIPGTQYAQGDGKMAQAVIHTALTFGGSFQLNNINPLQGFGTQLLPHNVWLNPAYWPFALFDNPLAALLVVAFIPVATASYGVRAFPALPDYYVPFPDEPELVRYLEETIGLRVGKEFRGSLTSVAPSPIEDAPSLYNLWMHGIPTLNEYSQLITSRRTGCPDTTARDDLGARLGHCPLAW